MAALNHQYRHMFPHVPKTAGSSMDAVPWVGGVSHKRMSRLIEECVDSGNDPDEYVKWAFVRHPLDRLMSVYRAYRQHPQRVPLECAILPFDGFLSEVSGLSGRGLMRHIHLRPQSWWLDTDMDFIGHYETLHSDWDAICMIVGADLCPIPHHNATDAEPIEVGEWERMTAREIYDEDYERFGYET